MSNPAGSKLVTMERSGHAAVARVRLDMPTDDELRLLRQTIDASARDPGVSLVIVDLSRVATLGSKELGTLVQIYNACERRQQKFKVAAATPRVRDLFSIAHVDQLMELTDSVEAAME